MILEITGILMQLRKFFVPSLADIVFASLFLGMLLMPDGGGMLNDGDTGYHIRAGEYIVKNLAVPTADIFSFHTPPLPWTAHEWLSEAIMYLTHSSFGLTGVVVLFIWLISVCYYFFFRYLLGLSDGVFLALGLLVLVLASSAIHWLARPHIFSLLLFLAWYWILDRYEHEHGNLLFLLPLIQVLWVNLHGGYIAGAFLLVLYASTSFYRSLTEPSPQRSHFRRKGLVFSGTLLVCLLASGINPYGFHILAFPFNLTGNRMIMDNVTEWLSPNFHEALYFKYYLLLLLGFMALKKRAFSLLEGLLVLLFTYMSLYSVRYIPLFAIIAAPILVRHADFSFGKFGFPLAGFLARREEVLRSVHRSARGFFWPLAVSLLGIVLVRALPIRFAFEHTRHPVEAVEFLEREHLPGNFFINDEYGDYLIYAAWPQYKVFFDGRSDMYGPPILKEYFQVIHLGYGMTDVFRKYDFNWVFYDRESPLSSFLLSNPGWRLVYSDAIANIFVRNTPENGPIIEKHRFVRLYRD